jgi:hypothetical protein
MLFLKGVKKIKSLQLFHLYLRIDIWSIEKMKNLTASASLLFTPPFLREITINPFIY